MGADGTANLSLPETTWDIAWSGRRLTRVANDLYRFESNLCLDQITLEAAYALCAERKSRRALVGLVEHIELAAREGRFADIDALLALTSVKKLDPSVLIGMLTMSGHAREHLLTWPDFLNRVERHLSGVLGTDRAEALLRSRR